jgi:uncharacterized protein with NRDE domain
MCTVIYIPRKDGYLLTSNRDEHEQRLPALPPVMHADVAYPVDGNAGGTWVFMHRKGWSMVLFNGAFEPHTPTSNYAKSRGMVLMEFTRAADPIKHWHSQQFSNIEPFSIILANGNGLFRMVWDGEARHLMELDSTAPHIWSSCTLYNTQQQTIRQQTFKSWMHGLEREKIKAEDVLSFLRSALKDFPHFCFLLKRPPFHTVSISIIRNDKGHSMMHYFDLLNETAHSIGFAPEPNLNLINSCVNGLATQVVV